jgi:replication initiation and membrane attachment protein DnaB
MLSTEEINEVIITYMDDYSTTMLDMCKAIEKAAINNNEKFILAIKTEVSKAVKSLENGDELDGILRLKGVQLALEVRDENQKR